ncbi:MAG TPA: polysaccharide deacetylase family protein [Candidatus Acidoferrales bacterium]|nr:polysaccharide deacetylase family protein [Candidatus Acidoferrales bacterium]
MLRQPFSVLNQVALLPWGTLPTLAVAGASLTAWGAMHPSAQLFGPTIRSVPASRGSRELALTIDDGPNAGATPQLLALLDQHRVHATFFLIGRCVRACPELTREIAARGHTVGNHTDTHPNLFWLTRARIAEELERCREAIAQATSRTVLRWMRPPYGFRGPQLNSVVRQQGYESVVMWSALAYDWKPQPAAPVIERLRRVRAGDILLLHDGPNGDDRRHVVDALAYWLPRWRDAGWEFVTLEDLFPREAAAGGAVPAQS